MGKKIVLGVLVVVFLTVFGIWYWKKTKLLPQTQIAPTANNFSADQVNCFKQFLSEADLAKVQKGDFVPSSDVAAKMNQCLQTQTVNPSSSQTPAPRPTSKLPPKNNPAPTAAPDAAAAETPPVMPPTVPDSEPVPPVWNPPVSNGQPEGQVPNTVPEPFYSWY